MISIELQRLIDEHKSLNQSKGIELAENLERYLKISEILKSPLYSHDVYLLLHPPNAEPKHGIVRGVLG